MAAVRMVGLAISPWLLRRVKRCRVSRGLVAVKGDADGVANGVAGGHGVGVFFAVVAGVDVVADGEFDGGEVFGGKFVERDAGAFAVAG